MRLWILTGIMVLTVAFTAGVSQSDCDSAQKVVIESFEQAASIKYTADEDGDYWQRPMVTEDKGTGDCEDKALYLQYLLKSHDISCCVVFGVEDMDSSSQLHAWVECRIKGRLYVLDATNGMIARRANMPTSSHIPVIGRMDVKEKLKEYLGRTGQRGINVWYEHLIEKEQQIKSRISQSGL
jgi:hypothetical protein